MRLKVNELASLGLQPVATTPKALLTMVIHCNIHTHSNHVNVPTYYTFIHNHTPFFLEMLTVTQMVKKIPQFIEL